MTAPAKKTARPDGRAPDALRPIRFTPDLAPAASGSVLVEFGRTRVICGASIEDGVPRWMRAQNVSGGWLTAEYSLLPYATKPRSSRESSTGKVSGRTQEIQRLIGRSLRAVTDLDKLGERTIWLDCDVLEADGGTRTAAVTGAWVALRRAVNKLLKDGALKEDPLREAVAAVSVGIVEGRPLLDLCYTEDLAAAVDMNVVMTASGRFVEVQGTAEETPYSREELDGLLDLAAKGIRQLLKAQRLVIRG
ncbi:MAG TPA: ribonuclease PH [Kiritimatiellia bacterium]|nr:ribonuclease PH [Kiritimatiellia bacterium]HRZ12883.1 ribonuclease PH [Kiritimatiellia bacterium]HSA19457.1 ribonuclease PH [Kiritimatiellia bacterium]